MNASRRPRPFRVPVGSPFAAGAMLLAACSSEATPGTASPPSTDAVELYPSTRILDQNALALLVDAGADQSTLTFQGTSPSLDALAAGQVLVGGIGPKTPYGLLRRVTGITRKGSQVVLSTERATITEAIRRGTITLPRTVLSRASAQGTAAEGARIQSLGPDVGPPLRIQAGGPGDVPRDFNLGVEASLGPGIKAGASLGFGVGMDLTLTINESKVEGKMTLSGSQSASVDVRALVSAVVDKTIPVATFLFAPIPISAGPVPLVIVPRLLVDVGVKAEVGASLAWSAKEDAKVDVGLALSTSEGIRPFLEGSITGSTDPLTAVGQAKLDTFAGLRIEVAISALLADAALGVGAQGHVLLAASTSNLPCFTAKATVDGLVSAKASVLGITLAQPQASVPITSTDLGSGSCTTNPALASGWATVLSATELENTPSVDVLADDSLWVTSSAGAVKGYAARLSATGESVWERTIDGSVLVSDVATVADGSAWLTGKNGAKATVGKVDASGTRLFVKELVVTGASLATILSAKGSDGSLALGGLAYVGVQAMPWAAKVDPSGSVVWAKTYNADLGEPHAMAVLNNGAVVMVGENTKEPTVRALALGLNGNGEPTFARVYSQGRLHGVAPVSGGDFAATGQTANGQGALVLRARGDGALGWGFAYEDTASSTLEFRGNAIAERKDGFVIAGRRGFGESADGWLLSVGGDGALGFSRAYGGAKADDFLSLAVTSDGGAVAAGQTKSFGGTARIFLARVPQSGALAFSSIGGATQTNVGGVKKALPGAEATLPTTSQPLPLTAKDADTKDWLFSPTTASRTVLGP